MQQHAKGELLYPKHCAKCPASKTVTAKVYSLAADHLVLVEFASQNLQGWLDDPSPQPENQVQSRF